MNKTEIIKLIKDEWYVQGFIASPLFLLCCGNSGFYMKKHIPFSYNHFMYLYRKDYCEMYYDINDLKRLWFELGKFYEKDKDYFKKIREMYRKIMQQYEPLKKEMDSLELKEVPVKKFFQLFAGLFEMTTESVGIAHIIEAFSLINDRKLRHKIRDTIEDKQKTDKYLEILSHPVNPSWINENEQKLYEISKIKDAAKQELLLKKHLEKYFWVRSNYLNAKPLALEDVKKEIENIKDYTPIDYEEIKKEKKDLIKELNLDEETIDLVHLIEFFTDFQDERKKYILISLSYLERIAEEICRRYNIKKEVVKYLLPEEVNDEFLKESNVNGILNNRRQGCLVIASKSANFVITGEELVDIEKQLTDRDAEESTGFHGLAASGGTAIGRAIICKSVSAIHQVEEGDILVAPMTRPDYMTAMKKAAAIVTDEGGVTCHAAIVSRELGIPCVIGTKQATKILKTGDLIEVKGNHGLITIIERK